MSHVLKQECNKANSRSFERHQYMEMRKLLDDDQDTEHKTASDIYGAEHLARLIGKFDRRYPF